MDLRILYEDTHLIVCYKPSGIAVQTSKIGAIDMVSLLKQYLGGAYVAVIHRLDQPVEGVLVFAKTPFAAKELNCSLQAGDFGKHYKAVLCEEPKEKKGRVEDYLVKDARTNTSSVALASDKNAKKAVLFYEVEQVWGSGTEKRCLANITLETGRHHQIRVQMANMGCPIWGDTKYNPFLRQEKGWQKIALCAYRLEFVHPKTKKQMNFAIEPEGEGFRLDK